MTHTRKRAGRIRRVLAIIVLGLTAAACGSESDYANNLRPPSPINVTAAITDDRVVVSPKRFGAGPIVLIIANQSSEAREVTIETDEVPGNRPGMRQRTSPVNARGTAELQVDVRQGTYRLSVDSKDIEPAMLQVGEKRASAQNELLQP
ncbi:MAG: hypothetical protein M3P50_05465 [Actinomycetota bacterium]|nr:hypothetical protein [Actinomycetota bacterium]